MDMRNSHGSQRLVCGSENDFAWVGDCIISNMLYKKSELCLLYNIPFRCSEQCIVLLLSSSDLLLFLCQLSAQFIKDSGFYIQVSLGCNKCNTSQTRHSCV